MEKQRQSENRSNISNALAGILRNKDSLIIYPGKENEIKLVKYYEEFNPDLLNGPLYDSNGPHIMRSSDEVKRIIENVEDKISEKKGIYSLTISEPELSKIISLEQRAMIMEYLDLKYSAMFLYNELATRILDSRNNLDLATQFSHSAYDICIEWKKMNIPEPYLGMGEHMNLELDIMSVKNDLDILSSLSHADQEKIIAVIDMDEKAYNLQLQHNMSIDPNFRYAMKCELLALAEESLSESKKQDSRMLLAISFHLKTLAYASYDSKSMDYVNEISIRIGNALERWKGGTEGIDTTLTYDRVKSIIENLQIKISTHSQEV